MAVKIPRNYAELKQRVPHIGIVILAILSWFTFSLLISVYNKWMFSDPTLDFKFPVLITSCHQLVLFFLSLLTIIVSPRFRLNYVDPNKPNSSREPSDLSYFMSPKVYLSRILPCALASSGDIGLGNSSLKYITISLYTMLKSSAVLIFTLFWGFLLRLEKVTMKLFLITLIMTLSVMMLVYGQDSDTVENETQEMKLKFVKRSFELITRTVTTVAGASDEESADALLDSTSIADSTTAAPGTSYADSFSSATKSVYEAIPTIPISTSSSLFIGCFLVLLASCMSGLRWALTQIVLRGNKYTKNPILTIFYLSPAMCVTLVVIGAQVEGLDNFFGANIWVQYGSFTTFLMLLFPGCLAFFMTLSQFVILQYAPLLTLSIAGIVRELITIFLGWLVFGDKLNFVNIVGLIITLLDIVWYNLYRLEHAGSKPDRSEKVEDAENLLSGADSGSDVETAVELNDLRK
ncbi:unnamed protein product [Ambrosiozyma monospora]|uniref:GDP-mannose transporter n=1 Tax=Ambrosiozyma monospora TaxID=43982 RepID=A0A9W6YY16_AMBMO|nr:unnamed protein product [Ambrosiozyma monospora]